MYDVICESTIPSLPNEQHDAGTRTIRGLRNRTKAYVTAAKFVAAFCRYPDIRVLIYDRQAEAYTVVYQVKD